MEKPDPYYSIVDMHAKLEAALSRIEELSKQVEHLTVRVEVLRTMVSSTIHYREHK
jgi:hypothetical protein